MSPLSDNPEMPAEEIAARLLVTASAMDDLSIPDGFRIVSYMRPRRLPAGTVLFAEGDAKKNDFMVLVMEGDVSVERAMVGHADNMVVSVMGPGSIVGEMGVLDGAPRSATCTAMTDAVVAILTRTALMRLLRDHPKVGSRFLLALSKRLADHLRATTRKLNTFAQMNKTLQEELNLVLHGRTVLKSDSQAGEATTDGKDLPTF